MSLEIKDLGGGGFRISCGEESVVVLGAVGKVTRAEAEAQVVPAGAIYEYLTVPVGPGGKGKSKLTFMCPDLPGSKQGELDDLILQLGDHPQWNKMLGKMAILAGAGPLMVVKGPGKRVL